MPRKPLDRPKPGVLPPDDVPVDSVPESAWRSSDVNGFVRRNFRTKKVLTTPVISMSHREFLVCRCLEEPHESDISLGDDNKDKPIVCLVEDCDTGTINLLICHTLLISAWERAGGPVTGRFFKIVAGEMKQGKNNKYRDLTVTELEESDTNG